MYYGNEILRKRKHMYINLSANTRRYGYRTSSTYTEIFNINILVKFVSYTVKKPLNLMWLKVWNLLNLYIKAKLICFAL